MVRRIPLLIVVTAILITGCTLPASTHPAEARAATLLPVAALEPTRGPASSRGEDGATLTAYTPPTPEPTGEPSAMAMATLPPTPAPARATAEPSIAPTATVQGTPAPTPKPGPDEPFAFVDRYRPLCDVLLDKVPALPQLRNLSCEAATMRMVLAARGVAASEEEILARMPRNENPHLGFRGDVDGDGHDEALKDYGTYAEVAAQALQSYGAPAQAVRGMSDGQLREAVRGGNAVIVWVTAKQQPRIIEADGYRLVEEEHVYVVVGLLKDGRLLVHDPWGVRADSGRDGTFAVWVMVQWDLFDRQAVVVPLTD